MRPLQALLVVVMGCSTPALEYAATDDASVSDAPHDDAGAPGADAPHVGDAADGGPTGDAEPTDATPDGAIAPPPDGGFFCGDAGVASCALCAGSQFECPLNGRCVSDCKRDCGGSGGDPIECVGCDGGSNAVVYRCTSAADPAGCLGGAIARCQAPNDVSDCPGPRQVRLNGACYACGEPNTGGQDCRGGNQCVTNGSNEFECR